MRTRSTAAWQQLLTEAEVPSSPVWGYKELLASDIGSSRGIKIRARRPDGKVVELIRSPLLTKQENVQAPPMLGEHTDEVLRRILQIDENEIAALKKSGVI